MDTLNFCMLTSSMIVDPVSLHPAYRFCSGRLGKSPSQPKQPQFGYF